jgi:hypothetical protein
MKSYKDYFQEISDNLQKTGKFKDLFNCVSGDKEIRDNCEDTRLEGKKECDLFITTVDKTFNLSPAAVGYGIAKSIIGCLPNAQQNYWGVCDTAISSDRLKSDSEFETVFHSY